MQCVSFKSNSDEGLEFRLTESLQRRPAHLWRSDKTEESDFRLPRTAHWEGKYLGGNWWVRFAHRFLWWGLWAGKLKQNLYPAFRQTRGRIEGVFLAFAVSQWPSAWNYFLYQRGIFWVSFSNIDALLRVRGENQWGDKNEGILRVGWWSQPHGAICSGGSIQGWRPLSAARTAPCLHLCQDFAHMSTSGDVFPKLFLLKEQATYPRTPSPHPSFRFYFSIIYHLFLSASPVRGWVSWRKKTWLLFTVVSQCPE